MDLQDLDALLASAKLPEATVDVCLRGDLVAEWEVAEKQLQELQQAEAKRTLAGSPEESAAVARVRELEEQMRSSTITVTLRALRRPDWARLIADHPPRDGNKGDQAMQVNQSTLFEALVKVSIVSPEMDDARCQRFLDALTDAQFDGLATKAWNLNRRDVDVPFSRTASRITETSDAK